MAGIEITGLRKDTTLRTRVAKRLTEAIEPLGVAPVAAHVTFFDENGPKGGVGMRCAILVQVPYRPGVRVEHVAESHRLAFDGAFAALERQLERYREKDRDNRRHPKKYFVARQVLAEGAAPAPGEPAKAPAPRARRVRRRKLAVVVLAGTLLGLLLASPGPAQTAVKWRGSGGWGPKSQYGRVYDAKTLTVVKGEVVTISPFTPIRGMTPGVHMVVNANGEAIAVHLGPEWFIASQDLRIEARDAIEVKGSQVTLNGKPVLIAAVVTRGDEVLRLRDDTGVPVWAGWRRR
jgi:ribosome-associated translation inhibitor RaiA